jgi:hypothetical protein
MRIYEGDYAYEIEPVVDPATQVSSGWRYKIYRIRPLEQLLRSGDAQSKEAAEQLGRRALDEVLKTRSTSREPAA